MRIEAPAEDNRTELSVVPLVNIVFLLLIFFMIVGRLASPEPLDIHPPRSVNGRNDTGRTVTILLTRNGQAAIGRVIVSESELAARVGRILADQPLASFEIKADARSQAVSLIRIMERLHAEGVQRLTLVTEKGS